MGIRRLRLRDLSEGATFDLNLAPMMDMLVSIIPFMLLSATFLQVLVINVPLPQPVADALAKDRADTKREVSIALQINLKTGFDLEVKDEVGHVTKDHIGLIANDFDYTDLHKKLVEVKKRFPKIFRLEMNPDETVPYKDIVKVMDQARDMDHSDPQILIDGAATPLLFPDAVLGNLMN